MGQSMLENGLHGFYFSFANFLVKIRSYGEHVDGELENFKPLKLQQLYFFLIVCVVQMAIAIIVFIIELIVHRINNRRTLSTMTATPIIQDQKRSDLKTEP